MKQEHSNLWEICFRCAVVLHILLPVAVQAQGSITNTTETITRFEPVNTTTIGSSVYYPDGLEVEADIVYDNSLTIPVTSDYDLRFALLNPASGAVRLLTGGAPHLSEADTVTMNPQASVTKGYPSVGTITLTPLNPVTPQTSKARLVLFEKDTNTSQFVPVATNIFGTELTFYTFPDGGTPDLNVTATVNNVAYERTCIVTSDLSKAAFEAEVEYTLERFDGFDFFAENADFGHLLTNDVAVQFSYTLRDSASQTVSLVSSSTIVTQSMPSWEWMDPNPSPVQNSFTVSFEIQPQDPANDLDLNETYTLEVTIAHVDDPGQPANFTSGNTETTLDKPLLFFNGNLSFGTIGTTLTSVNLIATSGLNVSSNHVETVLVLNPDGGVIDGHFAHTYGNGESLSIRLDNDGNATFIGAGTVTVDQPVPDMDMDHDVIFERIAPLTLSANGAQSGIRLRLPAGLGYTTNPKSKRLKAIIDFPSAHDLNSSLAPILELAYSPKGSTLWFCEESKPLLFGVDAVTWESNTGRLSYTTTGTDIEYVRKEELDQLEAVTGLANPTGSKKRSNAQVYRFVESFAPETFAVHADSLNHSARLDVEVSLEDPLPEGSTHAFVAHCPYGAEVRWNGAGTIVISNDWVVSDLSGLNEVEPVRLPYARDCTGFDCGGTAGSTMLAMQPIGSHLTFTGDGGLVAPGPLQAAPVDLTWGYVSGTTYAQTAKDFTDTIFHMPGHFLAGDQWGLGVDNAAAGLLFTGVDTNGVAIERADHAAAYAAGNGQYAGFNFDPEDDSTTQACESRLAGASIPFTAATNCKYYARLGGVSGIHQGVTPLAGNPYHLYGYEVDLEQYGFSYLDSQNVDSRTEGSLALPYPSDFSIDFTELKVTCLGGLTSAKLPAPIEDKIMRYWMADISPSAMWFDTPLGCNPDEGYLALAVAGYVSHLPQVFYGVLGYEADGNLITRAKADQVGIDRDSRLSGPNRVTFAGPSDEMYNLTLVSKMYYNNYDHFSEGPGFVNLPGKLDVPFFKDMKVLFQTRPTRGSVLAPIHLMGGWPDHGWTEGSDSFFNTVPFDTENKGYADASVADFRNQQTEQHNVRARQDWLGVVHFDYPLIWDHLDRSFESFETLQNKFLVVELEHRIDYMSAENAELIFGAEYAIPRVSLGNIAFSLAGEQVLRPFQDKVEEGIGGLKDLLGDQLNGLFEPIFDGLIDPLVDELYDRLKSAYETAAANANLDPNEPLPFNDWQSTFEDAIDCYITGSASATCEVDYSLTEFLTQILAGEVDAAAGLIKEVDGVLEDAQEVIDAFLGTFRDPTDRIQSDVDGIMPYDPSDEALEIDLLRILVERLLNDSKVLNDLGIPAGTIARLIDHELQPLLEGSKPTLLNIANLLLKIRGQIAQVRDKLDEGGAFAEEISFALASSAAEINEMTFRVEAGVHRIFSALDQQGLTGSPFDNVSKEEIKTNIRQEIEDAFYASPMAAKIQVVIKQFVYDLTRLLDQGVDSLFGEMNNVIKKLLAEALAGLDQEINSFLDSLRDVVGGGEFQGYAHIVQDAIRYARVDAHLEWTPSKNDEKEKTTFDGFIEIKQLNAEGSGSACYDHVPGYVNEVTMGALNVPVQFKGDKIHATIKIMMTFEGPPAHLIGMGGSFEMAPGDQIHLEAFTVTEFGAAVKFGEKEAYLACRARGIFDAIEVAVGTYFGKTCTLAPLEIADPFVATLLGDAPFTGAYIYGELWLPIYNYGCVFRISAGAGVGLGYFVEGPTYIGKMLLGVSGEALCIVTVKGDITLAGVKSGSDFRYKGRGRISGQVKLGFVTIRYSKEKTIEK